MIFSPSTVSVVLIYSAMAIYAMALVAFTLDLARRAAPVKSATVTQTSPDVRSGADSSPGITMVREKTGPPASIVRRSSSPYLRGSFISQVLFFAESQPTGCPGQTCTSSRSHRP
jgi:hypothetical protein